MITQPILKSVETKGFRLDITQSSDSYNGLAYEGDKLIAAVAVGLHESLETLIQKAITKVTLRRAESMVPKGRHLRYSFGLDKTEYFTREKAVTAAIIHLSK